MIILASNSPRRRELLAQIGLEYIVKAADIDEEYDFSMPPQRIAEELALKKARAVEGEIVIGADTIVVKDGEILGKPKDEYDARRMLEILSGTTHLVITGFAIIGKNKEISGFEITSVTFRDIKSEIDEYIATGEPMDKAGAYGIQGRGAVFVQRIEGDYYNVVGLPLCRIAEELRNVIY